MTEEQIAANTESLIQRLLAMPKTLAVVTRFADGSVRRHEVATRGQAENYAVGERRKIGRDLINRETGATVRVIAVDIVSI
jgi:hypothetical protein